MPQHFNEQKMSRLPKSLVTHFLVLTSLADIIRTSKLVYIHIFPAYLHLITACFVHTTIFIHSCCFCFLILCYDNDLYCLMVSFILIQFFSVCFEMAFWPLCQYQNISTLVVPRVTRYTQYKVFYDSSYACFVLGS